MSTQVKFTVDEDKALEVIVYLSKLLKNSTFFSVGKLLYFADKLSLERYGRFICQDTYAAMENGPVPSAVYDIMKTARDEKRYAHDFQVIPTHTIIPQRNADLDFFSESDLECLNDALASYGHMSYGELRDAAHDAAWDKAYSARGTAKRSIMAVEDIARMFDDGDDLVDYLLHRFED